MASEIFVDRDASDEYLCIICLDVMNRPAQVGCSGGHIFCRECINPLIKSSPSSECPVCRTIFHSTSIVEIPYLQRKIDDLFVICPHHHSLSQTPCDPIQPTEHSSTLNAENTNIEMQTNPPTLANDDTSANSNAQPQSETIIDDHCDEEMTDATKDTRNTEEDDDIEIVNNNQATTNQTEDEKKTESPVRRSKRIQQKRATTAGKKRKRSEGNEDMNDIVMTKRIKLNDANDYKETTHSITGSTAYCDWSGRYGDLSKHYMECPFELTKCTYAVMGCKEKVMRKDMDLHRGECEYFPVQCPQCITKISRGYLSKHISNDCMMAVIQCEECSTELVRKSLYKHLKHECGEISIACEYTKYGCQWIKRKEKETHYKECMEHHLKLVTLSHSKLEDTVFQLALRVEELETNMHPAASQKSM